MKSRLMLAVHTLIGIMAFGQRSAMELTFTAVNNTANVQLDCIKIMNRTQGGDTVLYWPDTVLSIYYTGIPENPETNGVFQVFQNYPNPVADKTTISLFVSEKDQVSIIVTDMLGRVIIKSDRMLDKGIHSFRFTPGCATIYCFTARWKGNSSSIKILNVPVGSYSTATLEYLGGESEVPQLKAIEEIQNFNYNLGDELLYIGYKTSLQQSGILDSPEESQTYTFQFRTNIPCPGTPTVEYEGQVYNTVQIFSQCWLKENLNVGTMIPDDQNMTHNSVVEKYCYNNEQDSCIKYGGLYQWNEMMRYDSQQGIQGICPPGWHLPTDEEWKLLEGAVDSEYPIGNPEWDNYWRYRGADAGSNLKANYGWHISGNGTDLYGFSSLPGGTRISYGGFLGVVDDCYFWSSSNDGNDYAWYRGIGYDLPGVNRDYVFMYYGFSVRCLRDE